MKYQFYSTELFGCWEILPRLGVSHDDEETLLEIGFLKWGWELRLQWRRP